MTVNCRTCGKPVRIVLPAGIHGTVHIGPIQCQDCFDREFPSEWYRRLWRWLRAAVEVPKT